MARPRKYQTNEEKATAARRSRNRYKQRQRSSVSAATSQTASLRDPSPPQPSTASRQPSLSAAAAQTARQSSVSRPAPLVPPPATSRSPPSPSLPPRATAALASSSRQTTPVRAPFPPPAPSALSLALVQRPGARPSPTVLPSIEPNTRREDGALDEEGAVPAGVEDAFSEASASRASPPASAEPQPTSSLDEATRGLIDDATFRHVRFRDTVSVEPVDPATYLRLPTPTPPLETSPGFEPMGLNSQSLALFLAESLYYNRGCKKEAHACAEDSHGSKHALVAQPCHNLADFALLMQNQDPGKTSSVHLSFPSLRRAPAERPLPDVLDSDRLLGYNKHPEYGRAFVGSASSDVHAVPRLCMDVFYDPDHGDGPSPRVSYDIDSICGVASSLAFSKRGLDWCLNNQLPTHNITSSVHITIPVPPPPDAPPGSPSVHVPLHHVPHFLFGFAKGFTSDLAIHFFFPRMYKHNQKRADPLLRTLVNGNCARVWFDDIMLPSVRACVDINTFQHFQKRYESLRSLLAAPKEGRLRPGTSTGGNNMHKQTLQDGILRLLTDKLRERVSLDPALFLFADFVIYFSAKNIKLGYMKEGAGAFGRMSERFLSHWDAAIDNAFLVRDKVFVDVAKQTSPPELGVVEGRLSGSARSPSSVYLYRTCCLDTIQNRHASWVKSTQTMPRPHTPSTFSPRQTRHRANVVYERDGVVERGDNTMHKDDDDEDDEYEDDEDGEGGDDDDDDEEDSEDFDSVVRKRIRGTRRARSVESRKERLRRAFNSATIPSFPVRTTGFRFLPTPTAYPWAMTADASCLTLEPAHNGPAMRSGLAYSQYYTLTKGPFDAHSAFVFQSSAHERLALSPATFDRLVVGASAAKARATLRDGYLRAKKRAVDALSSTAVCSYGVREEHRVTYALFLAVRDEMAILERQAAEPATAYASPFFSIPSSHVTSFLYAQLNRFSFLFESVLVSALASQYSTADSVTMIAALRFFHHCYRSNRPSEDRALFASEYKRRGEPVKGLGLCRMMHYARFGWWPADCFDFYNWSFQDSFMAALRHASPLLSRSLLPTTSVSSIGDLLPLFSSWLDSVPLDRAGRHSLSCWEELAWGAVLHLFSRDVWERAVFHTRVAPELIKGQPVAYCWEAMHGSFKVPTDARPCGPKLVASNRIRYSDGGALLQTLFTSKDLVAKLPCAQLATSFMGLLEKRSEGVFAETWRKRLFRLLILTHFVLPFPESRYVFCTGRGDKAKRQRRRIQWISLVMCPSGSATEFSNLPNSDDVRLSLDFVSAREKLLRRMRRAYDVPVADDFLWPSHVLLSQWCGVDFPDPLRWSNDLRHTTGHTSAAVVEKGKPFKLRGVAIVQSCTTASALNAAYLRMVDRRD